MLGSAALISCLCPAMARQVRMETNEFNSGVFTVRLITVFLSLEFPAHLKNNS
jgi:hypothetical protein